MLAQRAEQLAAASSAEKAPATACVFLSPVISVQTVGMSFLASQLPFSVMLRIVTLP
jgi:hypothetical protein